MNPARSSSPSRPMIQSFPCSKGHLVAHRSIAWRLQRMPSATEISASKVPLDRFAPQWLLAEPSKPSTLPGMVISTSMAHATSPWLTEPRQPGQSSSRACKSPQRLASRRLCHPPPHARHGAPVSTQSFQSERITGPHQTKDVCHQPAGNTQRIDIAPAASTTNHYPESISISIATKPPRILSHQLRIYARTYVVFRLGQDTAGTRSSSFARG